MPPAPQNKVALSPKRHAKQHDYWIRSDYCCNRPVHKKHYGDQRGATTLQQQEGCSAPSSEAAYGDCHCCNCWRLHEEPKQLIQVRVSRHRPDEQRQSIVRLHAQIFTACQDCDCSSSHRNDRTATG